MSMSVDGYIAGPNISQETPMGEGGMRLHDWLFNSKDERDAQAIAEHVASCGAVIVGGFTYEIAIEGAWASSSPFNMPAFVVTHRIPKRRVDGFVYVIDGQEDALHQAKEIAGEKNVWVMGGARAGQALISASLIDEVHIQLISVLLGGGTRLFEQSGKGHIELERLKTVETETATHLYFRVLKDK